MRESRLFLNFFKHYLLLFLTCLVAGGLISWYYHQRQPVYYTKTAVFELQFSDQSNSRSDSLIETRVKAVDTVVTLIRLPQVQQRLKFNTGVQVESVKIAPLLLQLRLRSTQKNQLDNMLNLILPYVENKLNSEFSTADQFKLIQQGVVLDSIEKPAAVLATLVIISSFLLVGLIASLIHTYLRRF